jgi:hypothetical protein
MSATPEEFYSRHAKAWKSITSSEVYRDAIDTIKQTSPSLKIMDITPPEVAGIGHIILAKQQGAIETLIALSELADVPQDFSDELPPASALYPDPLEELEEQTTTKPRKRK